jgi:ribosomal-protein-alanine N-acetyltransferase
MGTRIRDANFRDLPRIVEIEQLAFSAPWSIESFKRELILPFSRILVAMAGAPDSQPVGFLCRWLVADECHVLNLAVHPKERRGGIGKMLMCEAIGEAKAKHIRFVTLEVRRSNVAARSLYRKLSFVEQCLRPNYYGPGEDAIVMELCLTDNRR